MVVEAVTGLPQSFPAPPGRSHIGLLSSSSLSKTLCWFGLVPVPFSAHSRAKAPFSGFPLMVCASTALGLPPFWFIVGFSAMFAMPTSLESSHLSSESNVVSLSSVGHRHLACFFATYDGYFSVTWRFFGGYPAIIRR